jgi:hypothetical protein
VKDNIILMEYHTLLHKANYTKFSDHTTESLHSNELFITMEEEVPTECSKTEEQPAAINKEQHAINNLNRDIKNGKRFVVALIAFTSITVVNWFIPRHQWPWKFLVLEKTQDQTLSLPAQLQQYYNLRVAQLALERPVMSTFFEPVEGGCCGMTEQGHLNLLKAWEEAWQTWVSRPLFCITSFFFANASISFSWNCRFFYRDGIHASSLRQMPGNIRNLRPWRVN